MKNETATGNNVRLNDELGAARDAANAYCRANLQACCSEILEWKRTGLLRDGEVRILADMFSFAGYCAMAVAEEAVKVAAMERVLATPNP